MVVLPIVVLPVLMLVLPKFLISVVKKEQQRVAAVALRGTGALANMIKANPALRVVSSENFEEDIRERKIDAAVTIPDDFEEKISNLQLSRVVVHVDSTEVSSKITETKILQAVTQYRDDVIRKRLERFKVDPTRLVPFTVDKQDVASEELRRGAVMATILPYILIILCLTGATYVAIDLTAGEKERGTLETLLVSPASRLEIVAGKFATVFLASLTSAALAAASMGVTALLSGPTVIDVAGREAARFELSVPFASIPLLVIILLPIAACFSSLLMCVSLFARSYKEAMSYISPLLLVAILPAVISAIPGVRPTLAFGLVPIANVSLGMGEILKGHIDWAYLGVTFASSVVLSILSVLLATRLFLRESVLFRGS